METSVLPVTLLVHENEVNTMLDTPIMSLLETSLDYSSTQQSALAANIANLNTPGYERKEASFASVLAQASGGDQNSAAPLPALTDSSGQINFNTGFDGNTTPDGEVPVVTDTSAPMRVDGNNIDVDSEMSRLAENQIYYQAVSQFMSGQFSGLKYVISGG
jgi:flagellar basal-body rod protein FlgB